ncbi:MAG: GerMN domain-containing protein [Proteobacteria bacterium]|nr:GerMN domain-containing protein [Pseudomonadota bacterium]
MKNHNICNVSFFMIVGIVICVVFLNMPVVSSGMDQVEQNKKNTEEEHLDRPVVHLYFSDKDNSFLKAETRDLFHPDNPTEFGKNIVEALIEGPRTGLMRTIPANTTLKAFYITRDSTAYVDMSDTIRDAHPGGVKSELFTIYSMVNSLTLNIPEIDAVKILISGKEAMTLNGHINVRFPFKANMLLIR